MKQKNCLYRSAQEVQGEGRVRALSIRWEDCRARADMYWFRKLLNLDISFKVAQTLEERARQYIVRERKIRDGVLEPMQEHAVKIAQGKEIARIKRYYGMSLTQWLMAFSTNGMDVVSVCREELRADMLYARINEIENLLYYHCTTDEARLREELFGLYELINKI